MALGQFESISGKMQFISIMQVAGFKALLVKAIASYSQVREAYLASATHAALSKKLSNVATVVAEFVG